MASKLILFIHGLGGDGRNTWAAFPDLIREDAYLKYYDTDFFNYPTSLFSPVGYATRTFSDFIYPKHKKWYA